MIVIEENVPKDFDRRFRKDSVVKSVHSRNFDNEIYDTHSEGESSIAVFPGKIKHLSHGIEATSK